MNAPTALGNSKRKVHANKKGYRYKIAASKARTIGWGMVKLCLIFGISFVILYPLIIKLSVAVMSQKDLNDMSVRWITKAPTLANFKFAFRAMHYNKALLNTLFTSGLATGLSMFSCSLSAYAFARLKFPFSKLVFAIAVFSLVVPPQTYMVAMYAQFRFFDPLGLVTIVRGQEGILDTFLPILIKSFFSTGIRNGLYIYLMVQFFKNMPIELEEAAYVDGAGSFKIFYKIMLPNSIPILVTIGVFSIVWQWNDEFYSSLFSPSIDFLSTNLYNINTLINNVNNQINSQQAVFSLYKNAAALITIAPLIILFLIAQKFFIKNFGRSGIVG